jgi:hypothetical protein
MDRESWGGREIGGKQNPGFRAQDGAKFFQMPRVFGNPGGKLFDPNSGLGFHAFLGWQ